MDEAAAALVEASIDALAYASTSSGYVIGFDAEADMVQRLRDRWALPATSSKACFCHCSGKGKLSKQSEGAYIRSSFSVEPKNRAHISWARD